MARFSERMGLVPQKQIQVDGIDGSLRNRIINCFTNLEKRGARFILDKLGILASANSLPALLRLLNSCDWHTVYDIIELTSQYLTSICEDCSYLDDFGDCNGDFCTHRETRFDVIGKINEILEDEKSGYRLIEGAITPITNKSEIESLVESMNTPFDSVNTHMKKALELYSNRQNPDYENSIKESICAVEAMCRIITDTSGKSGTLGQVLKKLKDSGINLHGALIEGFDKLYGYTSDEDGIRHGGIDFSNAPAEDSKYMLVSCSAFVNYLKEKYNSISSSRQESKQDIEN